MANAARASAAIELAKIAMGTRVMARLVATSDDNASVPVDRSLIEWQRSGAASVVETQHIVVDERAALCGRMATLQTQIARAVMPRYLWCERNTRS